MAGLGERLPLGLPGAATEGGTPLTEGGSEARAFAGR